MLKYTMQQNKKTMKYHQYIYSITCEFYWVKNIFFIFLEPFKLILFDRNSFSGPFA